MRQIRNSEKQLFLLLVRGGCLLVQESNLIADFPHPRFEFLRVLSLCPFPADFLAQSFPVGVELLQSGLRLAPFRIHAQHFIDLRRVIVAATRRQPAFHKVGLFANETDVEHGFEYQS